MPAPLRPGGVTAAHTTEMKRRSRVLVVDDDKCGSQIYNQDARYSWIYSNLRGEWTEALPLVASEIGIDLVLTDFAMTEIARATHVARFAAGSTCWILRSQRSGKI